MQLIGNLTPDVIQDTNNALLAQATHLGGSSIASGHALSSIRCTEFAETESACVAVILTGKASELKALSEHIGEQRGLDIIWNKLSPEGNQPETSSEENDSADDS